MIGEIAETTGQTTGIRVLERTQATSSKLAELNGRVFEWR
jgi:hypothetical protein